MEIAILLLIGLAFFIANALIKKQRKDEAADIVDNKLVASLDNIPDFKPAIVHGYAGYMLALDPASEMFAFGFRGHKARPYHFSQLIAVEVQKDNETVVSTKGRIDAKGAAVATALIGPLGMALGAKTSSRSTSETFITKLSLKIYVNDLYTPCFEIPFPPFEEDIAEIDGWFGRFKTILVMMERQSGAIDPSKAIQYRDAAPLPDPDGRSWSGRMITW